MNEPQLSAEMDIKINRIVSMYLGEIDGVFVIFEPKAIIDELKHFFATALEEQKKATLDLLDKAELEKWFDMPDTTENWKTWKKIRNTINREDV